MTSPVICIFYASLSIEYIFLLNASQFLLYIFFLSNELVELCEDRKWTMGYKYVTNLKTIKKPEEQEAKAKEK